MFSSLERQFTVRLLYPGPKQLLAVLFLYLLLQGTAAGDSTELDTGPGSRPFTAEALVSWVLRVNPGLNALRVAADAASQRIEGAGSFEDPQLAYGIAPTTISSNRGARQKIDLSQIIPWPGTLAARSESASYMAEAAKYQIDVLRLDVVAETKATFAEWHFVGEAFSIHRDTLILLDELVHTTSARYAAGKALRQDVLQAELRRADFGSYGLRLAKQRTIVRSQINKLLNRAPDAQLPRAVPFSALKPVPSEVAGSIQHPVLQSINAKLNANNYRVQLAEKAFYPNLKLSLGYNGLWDDVDKRPMIGVSINMPLDRKKRQAELNRVRAESRRVEWMLVERRTELIAAIASSTAEAVEAWESIALYENELVPLTDEYFQATLSDYRSGTGAFLNVIAAEQRKLETQLGLARARADYYRRLADLERWSGGSIDQVTGVSR